MPPWPGEPREPALPPLHPDLCYRFVLSNPHMHVTLTGPRDRAQLDEDLDALERGPLPDDEMAWVRAYGEHVHAKKSSATFEGTVPRELAA